jgi:hypothetical protein
MVGNNEVMSSVSIGQYKYMVLKADGTRMDLTLKDVQYIPKLMVNLRLWKKRILTFQSRSAYLSHLCPT